MIFFEKWFCDLWPCDLWPCAPAINLIVALWYIALPWHTGHTWPTYTWIPSSFLSSNRVVFCLHQQKVRNGIGCPIFCDTNQNTPIDQIFGTAIDSPTITNDNVPVVLLFLQSFCRLAFLFQTQQWRFQTPAIALAYLQKQGWKKKMWISHCLFIQNPSFQNDLLYHRQFATKVCNPLCLGLISWPQCT